MSTGKLKLKEMKTIENNIERLIEKYADKYMSIGKSIRNGQMGNTDFGEGIRSALYDVMIDLRQVIQSENVKEQV